MLSHRAHPLVHGATVARLSRPVRSTTVPLREPLTPVGQCRPLEKKQIVCAANSRCICPLADHVTDEEREVMNAISRSASRLATAVVWIFALVAVAATLMLVLR